MTDIEQDVRDFEVWFTQRCADDGNPAGVMKLQNRMMEAFLEGRASLRANEPRLSPDLIRRMNADFVHQRRQEAASAAAGRFPDWIIKAHVGKEHV